MRATTSASTPSRPQDGPQYLTTRRTSGRTASDGDSGLGKGLGPSPIHAGQLLLLVPCRAAAGRGKGHPQDDASRNDHEQTPPKVHVKAEVALARSGRGE